MKIEHIGIAVKDLNVSNPLFEKLLGKSFYKEEEVASEGVRTSFFELGESKIELVGSEKNDSAIEKYLEKNREGIHHIAFGVDNLEHLRRPVFLIRHQQLLRVNLMIFPDIIYRK